MAVGEVGLEVRDREGTVEHENLGEWLVRVFDELAEDFILLLVTLLDRGLCVSKDFRSRSTERGQRFPFLDILITTDNISWHERENGGRDTGEDTFLLLAANPSTLSARKSYRILSAY